MIEKIALKVFIKRVDDKHLAKAVKIKKLKSIDEALKLVSTIKLSDKIRLIALDQNNGDANLKTF